MGEVSLYGHCADLEGAPNLFALVRMMRYQGAGFRDQMSGDFL
jgi:hypothetical protein